MAKDVIIAEKPNLARNIISGIKEKFQMKDGFAESSNYIVTWAFGHLFELYSIEEYLPDYNPEKRYSWNADILPFYPKQFKFSLKKDITTKKVDSGVKKQFLIIKKLIERSDVSKVYNCGDADREGEIIVRLILKAAGNKKPVLRIWSDDQSPDTLYEAIKNAHSDKEYDNLANEGMARAYIDWMYGINLTRYISIKAGTLERIGRCVTVIVDEIYKRDMEIKNFIPVPYYAIESDVNNVKLISLREFKSSESAYAASLCHKYNAETAIVIDKKTERKSQKPSKPFSVTKFQNFMGKNYKYPPDKTLLTLQTLYEAGYVSYPRTSSEYYASGEKGKVIEILEQLKQSGYNVALNDSWFNDKYVESHGALRISKLANNEALEKFSPEEINVYNVLLNHMLADFCAEELLIDQTEIKIALGELEEFTLRGARTVKKGWSIYEEPSKKDKELPELNIGDIVPIDFISIEKKTAPPKHYTISSLNNMLENPFKKSSDDDVVSSEEDFKSLTEGLAIGTGATRAGIIRNAIQNKYIKLDKGSYYILPNGIYMIETLKKLNINMDKFKTVEIGRVLKQISSGKASLTDGINIAKEQINTYINNSKDIVLEKADVSSSGKEEIGHCPKCSSPIYESEKTFYCSNKDCSFALFKDSKWWKNRKKKFTKTIAKGLLKNKRIKVKGLYSEKTGKTYDAMVVMDTSEKYVNFKLEW